MATTHTWRPLPLSADDGVPPLLVAFESKASEYSIQVTDMSNIWSESLERKAICIRAWSENTSIDPSDTPENMAQFLQVLRSSLDETIAGHDQTTVTLSQEAPEDPQTGGLKLVASCNLPGFQPLVWPFMLKRASSSAVAAEFSIPLVEALHAKSRKVDMLVQALKQKDSVIAKLADKLEATGTGLEHVFTALSGRKKVTREAADDKIRGLAPFDERKLETELQDDPNQPEDVAGLVQRVFRSPKPLSSNSISVELKSLDDWWLHFGSVSSLPYRGNVEAADSTKTVESDVVSSPVETKDVAMSDGDVAEADDDDDDFQVQSTPPRFKSKQSEDASKAKEPTLPSKVSAGEPKKSAGRLGAIGGKKQAAPTTMAAPKSPSPPPPSSKATIADDDETASETASDVDETASLPDDAASSPPAAVPSSPAKPVAKKGGLGRIGGSKTKPPAQDTGTKLEASEAPSSPVKKEPVAAAPKRLGVIGKRIGGGTAADDAQRGRGTSRDTLAETKRETSQERADRKREKLKMELEKKAAAGPAKKKRRF